MATTKKLWNLQIRLLRLSRTGTGITAKTIWKSIGVDVVDSFWDNANGAVKDIFSNMIDNATGSDETALLTY